MFRKPAFLALVAATVLFSNSECLAQESEELFLKPAAGRQKLNRSQNRQVAAELERQQEFLRGVSARFEAVANHDFTPLLQYSYVWIALHENRGRMTKSADRMSSEQSKLFAKSYDELEKEVVATFGDFQLSILNDVLELNELQFDAVQKALEADLNSRRGLLKTKELSDRAFAAKLNALSAQTETRILAVLFPEQRKIFDRQVNFNRDRLVG